MRLRKARVTSFRSIVDTGIVDIEDVVTVIVGKNEQGKTSFLRGLASFNRDATYQRGDLPAHLRPSIEAADPATVTIVTLWLAPEPSECELIERLVADFSPDYQVVGKKFFDNHYEFFLQGADGDPKRIVFAEQDVEQFEEQLSGRLAKFRTALVAHASRETNFKSSADQAQQHLDQFLTSKFRDPGAHEDLLKTLDSALRGLPGTDKLILRDVQAVIADLRAILAKLGTQLSESPQQQFERLLPRFVLHTSLDKVPNEVSIENFVSNAEATSRGMLNLCRASGLSLQKILELSQTQETAQREAYEDHYKASISGAINEFWTQAEYTINFRIENNRLSVSISDDLYSPRIAPLERSDGFQWYLSFHCALLSEQGGATNVVILLDNPGLELHPDGQRDIKRFLEERLPEPTQVVYVTHSPAMLDPSRLEQIRKVERLPIPGGTKVGRICFADTQGDLLEPVRSAIGASLITSLMSSDKNILVEGVGDKPIFDGMIAAYHEGHPNICVNGSIAETADFLPSFYERSGLPYIVLLDADSGAREKKQELIRKGVPEAKIFTLDQLVDDAEDGVDFEIEDLLSEVFYSQAVKAAYPDRDVALPAPGAGKRTKRYERSFKTEFGIGFNKARVAESVKRLLMEGQADQATTDAIRTLLAKIKQKLE